jgi:hypothetical protein
MVDSNTCLNISHNNLNTSNSSKSNNTGNKERNFPHDMTAMLPEEEQQRAKLEAALKRLRDEAAARKVAAGAPNAPQPGAVKPPAGNGGGCGYIRRRGRR